LRTRSGQRRGSGCWRCPETAIGAVKDGARVRIKGRVSAREALRVAPISERECVGFHLTIELYEGGDDHEWRKVVDQDDFAPFAVRRRDRRGGASRAIRIQVGFARSERG
jgi:hypothetical protein